MTTRVRKNQIDILWPATFKNNKQVCLHLETGRRKCGWNVALKGGWLLIFSMVMLNGIAARVVNSHEGPSTKANVFCSDPISDTIVVFDTVFTYDTVYTYQTVYDTVYHYDTLYVAHLTKLKSIFCASISGESSFGETRPNVAHRKGSTDRKSGSWSVELYGELFRSSYRYSSYNLDADVLKEMRKQSVNPEIGKGVGINLNYQFAKNFSLSTGLGWSQFSEKLEADLERQNVNSDILKTHDTVFTWMCDTIRFIDTDAWLLGDTTAYIEYYDSTLSQELRIRDSIVYDTVSITNKVKASNRWEYFEVPIVASFHYNFGNLNLGLRAGLITGFLYKHQRFELYPSEDRFNIHIQEDDELEQLSLFVSLSFYLEYHLSDRWGLLAEPWYRHSLIDFTKTQGVGLKLNSQGLRAGVRYYF